MLFRSLFENALQCVQEFDKEKRYLEMKIQCQEGYLFVQTRNPYQEELLLDPDTGLPKSKKSGNHGMGMQSIQAFSEKIRGTLGCCIDDGIFQMMLYAKFGGIPQGD